MVDLHSSVFEPFVCLIANVVTIESDNYHALILIRPDPGVSLAPKTLSDCEPLSHTCGGRQEYTKPYFNGYV